MHKRRVFNTTVKTAFKGSSHSLVKKYKPNKQTGKLELVEVIDPFKTLTPVNTPYRNYRYRYKRKEDSKHE